MLDLPIIPVCLPQGVVVRWRNEDWSGEYNSSHQSRELREAPLKKSALIGDIVCKEEGRGETAVQDRRCIGTYVLHHSDGLAAPL